MTKSANGFKPNTKKVHRDKTQAELFQYYQHEHHREYLRLKRNVREALDCSGLSDFYKEQIIFEFIDELRRPNPTIFEPVGGNKRKEKV